MKRRSFLTGAAASLLPTPALAAGGWPIMSTLISIGGIFAPIPTAEAAVVFLNPSLAPWLPPNSPGTIVVNNNGLLGSSTGLPNMNTYSRGFQFAVDYQTGWQFSIAGVQSLFNNADLKGDSSLIIEIAAPGTGGYSPSLGPILIIRVDDPPTELAQAWAVPGMINNTGPFVAHHLDISVTPDSPQPTATFAIQVAQDNNMFTAYAIDPNTYHPLSGIQPNRGPTGEAFAIPWYATNNSILTYGVANFAVPTATQGTYIPGGQFRGLPNTYYGFHGALGRLIFDPNYNPNRPFDIRYPIMNNTFVGPLPNQDFTIIQQGGAGLLYGTPGNGPTPPVYLIGGANYPFANAGLPAVTFGQNQGLATAFTVPMVPPGTMPYVYFEPLNIYDTNGNLLP